MCVVVVDLVLGVRWTVTFRLSTLLVSADLCDNITVVLW